MITAAQAFKITCNQKIGLYKTLYIINKNIKNEAKKGKVHAYAEVESSILAEIKNRLIHEGYQVLAILVASHDKSKYLIVIYWGE